MPNFAFSGDLFQIDDNLIVTDLSQLINQIETISSAHDFSQKLNDQSVVEICLTRITSAIRDTGTIEKHAKALVSLLESCLRQDLRPSKKDSDPFHAKIANELISCIFLVSFYSEISLASTIKQIIQHHHFTDNTC